MTGELASANSIELTMVAVVWNDRASLPGLLDSIYAQVDLAKTELIFVDNGSDDDTVRYLREYDERIIVIENGVNAGYPVAMNRGIEIARGEFVVIANPDLLYRPGSIRAMLDELHGDAELAGVSPVIETPGDPPEIYPLHLTQLRFYYAWVFFSGMMVRHRHNRLLNAHLDYEPYNNDRPIPWIHGCCGMYRRTALDDVGGGFDERFFIYMEDVDLGRMLVERGWKLRMACDARVLHLEDQSCQRIAVPSRRFFIESWHKYHRKHSSILTRFGLYWVVLGALSFQMSRQLVKLCFGRVDYLPAIAMYLRVHWLAPFKDFDGRRRAELTELKQRWFGYPGHLASRVRKRASAT